MFDFEAPPEHREVSPAQKLMETSFYAQYYESHMRPKLTRLVSPRPMAAEYQLSARYLDLVDASSVLDVACGTGNYTRYFANIMSDGSQLTGVDLSWPMLRNAAEFARQERMTERVQWVRADAQKLPFRTAAFDRVHCSGALHMMDDADEALSEFVRVCEPGGIIVIGTFVNGRNPIKKAVNALGGRLTKFRFFDRAVLHETLQRHRLTIIEESRQGASLVVKTVRRH